MEAFTQFEGTTLPLMNDNIDTDQILPKNYLKRVEKTGFGEFLFDDWRYLPQRKPNPALIILVLALLESTRHGRCWITALKP